ncbi:NAD(P)-binding protein [Tribonema minus]|uniref:NAD(P)-binding protein n=1 Tax=Tribonema minus TaxID=303371 RepID=A0A835YUI5_9STRA|nr:NAD(P)-binding protein [Tribonema minus]
MAREFLRRGDRVVVCGRGTPRVAAAVAALQREFNLNSGGGAGGGSGGGGGGGAAVWGTACDVSSPNDVRALGAFARNKLAAGGGVHLWINNAGCAAGRGALMDADPQDIAAVVGTNTLGTLLCCREAMRTMAAQQNGFPGNVFNVDGAGVNGGATKRFAAYGATKRAMPQLTASLTAEIKDAGLEKRVQVHTMSPGMVLTDLLLEGSEPNTRKLFNALAEEPDTVAADLVPRLREVDGEKGSTYIKFLTTPQALGRLALGAPQILAGGRFFDGKGVRVKTAGAMYKRNGARKFYAEEDE